MSRSRTDDDRSLGPGLPILLPHDCGDIQFCESYGLDWVFRTFIRGQAPVILGAVTIFGILSWYFVPEDKWLRREQILQQVRVADEPLEGNESIATVPALPEDLGFNSKRTD